MGFCLLTAALLLLTGCQSRKTFLNQNDELRAERQRLTQRVEELEQQLTLRESELAALKTAERASPIPGVEPARIVGIILGSYSGGIDTTRDGKPDQMRVYLRPVDRDGRFMAAAGSARLRLIHTPADGQPTTLLDKTWDPAGFRGTYRSGFTGTHYTLAALLEDILPDPIPQQITLQVDFTEASGQTYTAQRPIDLRIAIQPAADTPAE